MKLGTKLSSWFPFFPLKTNFSKALSGVGIRNRSWIWYYKICVSFSWSSPFGCEITLMLNLFFLKAVFALLLSKKGTATLLSLCTFISFWSKHSATTLFCYFAPSFSEWAVGAFADQFEGGRQSVVIEATCMTQLPWPCWVLRCINGHYGNFSSPCPRIGKTKRA